MFIVRLSIVAALVFTLGILAQFGAGTAPQPALSEQDRPASDFAESLGGRLGTVCRLAESGGASPAALAYELEDLCRTVKKDAVAWSGEAPNLQP